MEARRQDDEILRVLTERDCQSGISYTATLAAKNEGRIKTFPTETERIHH